MSLEKLDQRLIEELRVRMERSSVEGRSLEETGQEKLRVTIELVDPLRTPRDLPREKALEDMEKQAEQAQAGIIDTLQSMGVTGFDRLILSNSIVVTLTVDQIKEIANREDVKIIRLVREEKVTL